MSTFVSVGNAMQPFYRLIESVLQITERLPSPVFIQHGNTPVSEKVSNCKWSDFVDMEVFQHKIINSELLIIHGGAGSLIHAIHAGKIPVVMPRRSEYNEHIDDHQLELAEALAKENKIVVAYEKEELEAAVKKAIMLQAEGRKQNNKEIPLIALVRQTFIDYEN